MRGWRSKGKPNSIKHDPACSTVAEEFTGYFTPFWLVVIYVVLVISTGGLAWAVMHSWPHRRKLFMRQCPLELADFVEVKTLCGDRKMARVMVQLISQNLAALQVAADNCYAITPSFATLLHTKRSCCCTANGVMHSIAKPAKAGYCINCDLGYLLQKVQSSHCQPQKLVVLQMMVYVYDPGTVTFKPLPDMPTDLPQQIIAANEALCMVAAGCEWTGFNVQAGWVRRGRSALYGTNDFTAGRPHLVTMATRHLWQAIYIVQSAEIAFIIYEDDYKLAALLTVVTLASCLISTYKLYITRLRLYQLVSQWRLVPIVQEGHVRAVSSHRLVPGDVVVLLPGRAVCDLVLLRGSCLVEESLLSGEAAQVRKSCVGGLSLAGYHPNTHHAYTVHSGTHVQQVWNEEDVEDEVLAMVVRTGMCTSMGAMMRQVVHSARPVSNPLVQEFFKFCAFNLIFQLAGFVLFCMKARQFEDEWEDAFQRAVDVFIAAWPTSTPLVLIVALAVRMVMLKRIGIDTLQPAKLQLAAATEVVCFDKTGTLTANTSDLHGMLPVVGGQLLSLQSDAMRWPNSLRQAAAVCNSLTQVSKSGVVGDHAERHAFNQAEARFLERNMVTLPLQTTHGRRTRQATLQILKRFEFEPSLMRSGVVAVELDNSKPLSDGLLIIKGATAVIEQQVGSDRLPSSYRQTVDDWSKQSYRVMAVASAQITQVGKLSLAHMSQQQIEARAGQLDLIGLVVLRNNLNTDSKATITQLQQRGGLRTIMVTGDYHHTAIAVAKGVGMVPPESRVVLIQTHAERSGALFKARKPILRDALSTPRPRQTSMTRAVSFAIDTQLSDSTLQDAADGVPTPVQHAADGGSAPLQHTSDGGPIRLQHIANGGSAPWLADAQVLEQPGATPIPADAVPRVTAQPEGILFGDLPQHALEVADASHSCAALLQAAEVSSTSALHSLSASFSSVMQPWKRNKVTPAKISEESLASCRNVTLSCTNATEGLAFSLDNGDAVAHGDTLQAFNAISQGAVQCCVTGPAFAYLLQQPNQALVHAVILNSVAFTRMKSEQKGQLMELLGSKGLQHLVDGQRHHIQGVGKSCLYCGDGINDLAALAAADVGMAVGAAEASAAATFSDNHYSVAGVCSVLREARALQAISVALIKYMALYQLADQLSVQVMFFAGNYDYTNNQSDAFDFIALVIGIAAASQPAASGLFSMQRLPQPCQLYNLVAVAVTSLFIAVMYIVAFKTLAHESWYQPDTGDESHNPVVTMVWCLCLVEVIVPAVMFAFECRMYCQIGNKPETMLMGALLVFMTLCCTLGPGFYDACGIYGFVNLPLLFRYKLELLCAGCSLVYILALVKARQLCAWATDAWKSKRSANTSLFVIP